MVRLIVAFTPLVGAIAFPLLIPATIERLAIDFSIRSMDGEINLKKQLNNLETWRDGFEFIRPKWGIYRSLAKEKNKLNPQDQIWMNNFSIRKWKTDESKK